jgi:DNA-binding NtrC family response regulator
MPEPLCLIVDDEPSLRIYLRLLLQRKGIRSLEAENAVEALRILDKLSQEINLLITDIQMPGDIDGLDLAYSVQNLSCSVILISGTADKAPEGFIFVRKPFTTDAILSAIDKAMITAKAGGYL